MNSQAAAAVAVLTAMAALACSLLQLPADLATRVGIGPLLAMTAVVAVLAARALCQLVEAVGRLISFPPRGLTLRLLLAARAT
jgi:hypothetical protein